MQIKKSLVVLVAAFAALMSASQVQSQTVTIRFSHYIGSQTMPGSSFEAWAKRIADDSKGTLVVQAFPNGQLGKAVDHYDMARDGIADLAWSVPGFQAGRFTMFSATELPFVASESPGGVAVFNDWYQTYATKEMADVKFCMAMSAPVSSLHFTSKKVLVPADIKGLRMRPTNTTAGQFLTAAGASVVNISSAETAAAFERGLLDGIMFTPRTMMPFGIEKYNKLHMEFPISLAMSAFVMNKKKYESLNAQQRAAVDKNCSSEQAQRVAKEWNDWEEEGRAIFEKLGGHNFYKISPAEQAQWRALGERIQQNWIQEANAKGYDGRKALDELFQRVRQRKVGF